MTDDRHESLADLTARLIQERLDEIDAGLVPRQVMLAIGDLLRTPPRSAEETEAAERLRAAVARYVPRDD